MTKLIRLAIVLMFGFGVAACAVDTTTQTTTTIQSATSSTTTTTASATTTTTASTTTNTTSLTASTTLRVFTLVELAAFNGDNGADAYIAVSGTVYDVTNVAEWENGWHKGMHLAGTDATTAFAGSPHSAGFLAQLTIVGTLSE